ncbi:MAG: ATP-dependent Clp protease adapter ClpS [Deltaproteobacteria bacterium]|nr:MAG: ATP-dependent Clp protease adapter ClpS [Deltaproteobacteria bacterium]
MNVYEPDVREKTAADQDMSTAEPPMFKVLLHNDDYTTMDFVVEILMTVFQKSLEEATRIMLSVHHHGIGMCGIYVFEVAETKVDTVMHRAAAEQFPLKCTMEKV